MLQHDAAQRQVQLTQRVQAALGRQLAFPDDNHVPSCGLQLRLVARVTLAVADDFLLPELGIGRRAVLLAPVSVPETAFTKITVRHLRITMSGRPGNDLTYSR